MNEISIPKRLTPIDTDYARWADERAALLRARKLDGADIENIAEEIEGLGRSGKYEIVSRLEGLLCHLLKWQFQQDKRSNSWRSTILEQRIRILDVLEESPSLKHYPGEKLGRAYIIGKSAAIDQTRLPEAVFPETCPYTIEHTFNPDSSPAEHNDVFTLAFAVASA